MQYDASVTETIQRRSQSSGAANPVAPPIQRRSQSSVAANPAAPPIQRRRQSSGAANPAAQPIQRRSQSSGAANPAAPPDGDDDGGGDGGGRIFGQVQPPNPITPRDSITRTIAPICETELLKAWTSHGRISPLKATNDFPSMNKSAGKNSGR